MVERVNRSRVKLAASPDEIEEYGDTSPTDKDLENLRQGVGCPTRKEP